MIVKMSHLEPEEKEIEEKEEQDFESQNKESSQDHQTLHLENFMKRRKKKLFSKGKTISVPKKPLTAYAIFVK